MSLNSITCKCFDIFWDFVCSRFNHDPEKYDCLQECPFLSDEIFQHMLDEHLMDATVVSRRIDFGEAEIAKTEWFWNLPRAKNVDHFCLNQRYLERMPIEEFLHDHMIKFETFLHIMNSVTVSQCSAFEDEESGETRILEFDDPCVRFHVIRKPEDFIAKFNEMIRAVKFQSKNLNIPLSYIMEETRINWNWRKISARKDVTFDIVLDHPELPWDAFGLSKNPNLTFEFIDLHPEIEWRPHALCKNSSLNINELIRRFGFLYRESLSKHPQLTIEIMLRNGHFFWFNYGKRLSRNPAFKEEDVLMYPQFGWDMKTFMKREDISPEIVFKMDPTKVLDLVYSPNLTYKFIDKIFHLIDNREFFLWELTRNPMTKQNRYISCILRAGTGVKELLSLRF